MARLHTTVLAVLMTAVPAAPVFSAESIAPASGPSSGEPNRPVVIGTVPNPAGAPPNRATPEVDDEVLTGSEQGDAPGADAARGRKHDTKVTPPIREEQ